MEKLETILVCLVVANAIGLGYLVLYIARAEEFRKWFNEGRIGGE